MPVNCLRSLKAQLVGPFPPFGSVQPASGLDGLRPRGRIQRGVLEAAVIFGLRGSRVDARIRIPSASLVILAMRRRMVSVEEGGRVAWIFFEAPVFRFSRRGTRGRRPTLNQNDPGESKHRGLRCSIAFQEENR